MSCYSASAFTQSAPQVSSDSFSLDDNIRVAANTCKGVEHHVADITALLIKTLGCSVSNEHAVFAERRRKFVQEPLHVFISTIVNEIAQDVLDIGGVIAAAHVLLMHLYISNPLAGASWSGHELFISAFSFAAQEQPASHAAGYIHDYVFWSKLSKFTVEEVMGMQLRLSAQLSCNYKRNGGRRTRRLNWRRGSIPFAAACFSGATDLYNVHHFFISIVD